MLSRSQSPKMPLRVVSLLSLVILILGACQPQGASEQVQEEPTTPQENDTVRAGKGDYVEFSIFWATDRKQTGDAEPATMFAGERSPDPLVYGTSKVSIPNDHNIGNVERPSKLWRIVFGEDPSRHMVLLQGGTNAFGENSWFEEINENIRETSEQASNDRRMAFVYIHGFNTTFEEAALRTAQIGYDLKFPGASILYSWPSLGSNRAYTTDEENARWSVGHLVQFLNDIHMKAGADEVTLIAHSLGARLLGSALKSLDDQLSERDKPPFDEIILSAPDIDADIFKDEIVPVMSKLANGRTLYASSKDRAMIVARDWLRGGQPRAGDAGENIVVVPGLETIDATDVRTDFWRHEDTSSRPVLYDISGIVIDGKRADERQFLEAMDLENGNGTFWRLPP